MNEAIPSSSDGRQQFPVKEKVAGSSPALGEPPIARQYVLSRLFYAKKALRTLYGQLERARTPNRSSKIIHRINFWIAEVERMLEDERRRDGEKVPSVSTEGEGRGSEERAEETARAGHGTEDVPNRLEGRDAGSYPE